MACASFLWQTPDNHLKIKPIKLSKSKAGAEMILPFFLYVAVWVFGQEVSGTAYQLPNLLCSLRAAICFPYIEASFLARHYLKLSTWPIFSFPFPANISSLFRQVLNPPHILFLIESFSRRGYVGPLFPLFSRCQSSPGKRVDHGLRRRSYK